VLSEQRTRPYFAPLASFLESARKQDVPVYPRADETFTALDLVAPKDVTVVILGQDPYFNANQAHGLAFSIKPPAMPPPSLQNIFRELEDDIPSTHARSYEHGSLRAWAKQGVLLLNAILTVPAGKPGGHACQGWESFTDAVIDEVSARRDPVVFVLWGSFAQSKAARIAPHHGVVRGAHPSPRSAEHGFFGSRPFSKVNDSLVRLGKQPIDWSLPADPLSP
jgi:uracil-DNA glycosylase